MPVTYALMKSVTADLYDWSLRKIPEDTKAALAAAESRESNPVGKKTLWLMQKSATEAEAANQFVCSDSGVPVYSVKIGTQVRFEGNIRQAITDGFADLVERINPPLLKHVTNPLTLERGYHGKDMPIVTFDLVDGADYVEIVCSPEGARLGSLGRPGSVQLPVARAHRAVRARMRAPRRLASLSAGRDRRRHRRHVRLRRADGEGGDAAAVRRDNPEPILAAMEAAPAGGGQRDRVRADGHGRRCHRDGGARQLLLGAWLHAGRGVLQLLDQPAHARPHLRRWPRRAAWSEHEHDPSAALSDRCEDRAHPCVPATMVVLDGEIMITAGLPTLDRMLDS